MATAFKHEIPDTSSPLASAAGKLALVAAEGAAAIEACSAAQAAFPAAYAEFKRLLQVEQNLPVDHSDEDVDAAADRTTVALDAMLAIPARTVPEAMAKVDAICVLYDVHAVPRLPAVLNELREVLARTAGRPGTIGEGSDAELLAAWERVKAASRAIEAIDPDAPNDADALFWRQRDKAEEEILLATAHSTAGALVKLRFALDVLCTERWVQEANTTDDDATLFARSRELDLDARMIVDAIETLSRRETSSVRDAFEAWVAAYIAYDAAPFVEDDALDPAYDVMIAAERALAAAPVRTAEDILLKLMPIAMHEHGPSAKDGIFELKWSSERPDEPYLEEQVWKGIIEGMLAVSPRIAELAAVPRPLKGADEVKVEAVHG